MASLLGSLGVGGVGAVEVLLQRIDDVAAIEAEVVNLVFEFRELAVKDWGSLCLRPEGTTAAWAINRSRLFGELPLVDEIEEERGMPTDEPGRISHT
jgi:hypothetical protein